MEKTNEKMYCKVCCTSPGVSTVPNNAVPFSLSPWNWVSNKKFVWRERLKKETCPHASTVSENRVNKTEVIGEKQERKPFVPDRNESSTFNEFRIKFI